MLAGTEERKQMVADSPVADEGVSGWHGHLSLRVKGVISLLVLVAYVGGVAVLVTSERGRLLDTVQTLERVHRQEEQMLQVNLLVARAILAANDNYYSSDLDNSAAKILLETTPLEHSLSGMVDNYPVLGPSLDRLRRVTQDLAGQPSRGILGELRSEMHELVFRLQAISRGLREEKVKLLGAYQATHDKLTLQTLSVVFLGIVVLGAIVTIFFTRLTWDIRRVGARAMSIVKGYRGRPLEVTRGDEIGGLMDAINRMQSELRTRERQLELARQQQFHQEKMAAVGSLAAAIAHEINNPIMAISGIAQVIADERDSNVACQNCGGDCAPELILEQTRRISHITRQIAEFSLPTSPEPQLGDVNSMVSNACNFMRFDKRLRSLDLKMDLDPQLPAVTVVADHLTQIIINLLVNSADALEACTDRKGEILVTTRAIGGSVRIVVGDNGVGMASETVQRACDEFFTTKPRGKGSGLGLFLCKSLVEQDGGTLTIESERGTGTKVTVKFPTNRGTGA